MKIVEGPVIALLTDGEHAKTAKPIVEVMPSTPRLQCQSDRPVRPKSPMYHSDRKRAVSHVSHGAELATCMRQARYRLGEFELCAVHAGGLLLDLAVAMSDACDLTSSSELVGDRAAAVACDRSAGMHAGVGR